VIKFRFWLAIAPSWYEQLDCSAECELLFSKPISNASRTYGLSPVFSDVVGREDADIRDIFGFFILRNDHVFETFERNLNRACVELTSQFDLQLFRIHVVDRIDAWIVSNAIAGWQWNRFSADFDAIDGVSNKPIYSSGKWWFWGKRHQ